MQRQRHKSGSGVARRILVIDDDEDTCFFVTEHLTRAGYQVETARDGNEGIAAALRSKPDAIILDLLMSGLDGWETARLLRAYDRTGDLPIIALTGVEGDDALARAKRIGCNVVLRKPIAAEEFERTIRGLLGDDSEKDTA